MLKILIGVCLGYLLFTNPKARQINADLLRAGSYAIAPADENKPPLDRSNDWIEDKR